MSSSIGVPVNPGPMDVETVSQSSAAGAAEDVDMANIQPEVAAGGGGAGGGGDSHPPPPPVADGAAGEGTANAVVAGDSSAPEEKAEPNIPEVVLVPLPPNFGKTSRAQQSRGERGRVPEMGWNGCKDWAGHDEGRENKRESRNGDSAEMHIAWTLS